MGGLSFTLVVRWKETEQETSVFHPIMPSWLRNQRAYAGLVLIKHYNNLSYYRISLGVFVNSVVPFFVYRIPRFFCSFRMFKLQKKVTYMKINVLKFEALRK